MNKVLICFVILFFGFQSIISQTVTISGMITDPKGAAISGALVIEKGTNNAVKSNSDGSYSIKISSSHTPTSLFFRYIGYANYEFPVDGVYEKVNCNPSLGSTSKTLNEIVVSASKKSERILNSASSVSILSESRIQQNTSLTLVDNFRKVAAVDIVPNGLVSINVAIRGFNNILSPSTLYLVDNRIAGVPAARVNGFQLIPNSNLDFSTIEVVRGPASALYGPYAANGVLAVYTKSPLDMENRMEVTLAMTSGFRSGDDDNPKFGFKADNSLNNLGFLNPELRIAGKLSKNLGIKVSGNYLSGSDYAYFDDREPNGKLVSFGEQSAGNPWVSDGTAPQIYNRNFKIKKIGGDVRLDWKPAENTEFIFSSGYAQNSNFDLSQFGGAQAIDWTSYNFHTRFRKGKFNAQYFINVNNPGNTFLIPQDPNQTQFTRFLDNSKLHGFQFQNSSKLLKNKLALVYGYDMFMTRPSGSFYGRFNNMANVNQYGTYLQSEYRFDKKWSATIATRLDFQDVIQEWMFSPRAAVIYKPEENQTFRLTYNRAFSSPTALNFFQDVNSGSLPTGASIRAFGNTGMNYTFGTDNLPMVNTSDGQSLNYTQLSDPALAPVLVQGLKQTFSLQMQASGVPQANADATAQLLLNGMNPTSLAPVDIVTGKPVDIKSITNKNAIGSTVTQTAEIGYKGFLMGNLSLAIDVYYTRVNNFVSPLTSVSYQVAIDPDYYALASTQSQMLANINAFGPNRSAIVESLTGTIDASDAEIVKAYTSSLVRLGALVNTGTITPSNTKTGNDLLLTYFNIGTIDLAGSDISVNYLASKNFNIEAAFSFVNKNKIPVIGASNGYISLNAPQYKSAISLEHKLPIDQYSVSVKGAWRWMDKFDASSGTFIGRVNAMNMFDLGFTWKPSNSPSTIVSLNINNVLDFRHQYFPLSAPIGRLALLKVQHIFGVR